MGLIEHGERTAWYLEATSAARSMSACRRRRGHHGRSRCR